jgi:HSP20 family molecular chaperone IbpA
MITNFESKYFDEIFNSTFSSKLLQRDVYFYPSKENKNVYEASINVAGYGKEDISAYIKNENGKDILSVETEDEKIKYGWYLSNRFDTNPSTIKITVRNGILHISISLREKEQSQKIPIEVN